MSEEKKHDGGTHDGGTIDRLNCAGARLGLRNLLGLCAGHHRRPASLAKDGAPAAADVSPNAKPKALSPKLEAKASALRADLPAEAAGTTSSAQAIGVGEGIGRGAQLELPPPSEIYRLARAEGFTGEFYLSVCCGRELLSNSVTRFCPMCGREITGDKYEPPEAQELKALSPKLEAKTAPSAEDLDAAAAEQAASEATR